MSVEIIPAIMPFSYKDLERQIASVDDFAPWVQLDVMDGKFVQSESWPYNGEDIEEFGKILAQEHGLPSWDKINLEIDMMVDQPEDKVIDWINAGAGRIIIHFESLHDTSHPNFIVNLKEQYGDSLEIALALNTTTPNDTLETFLPHLDAVQFMGIENVGYQEQEFDERVLEKIKDLRAQKPDITIAVDGSVNKETAKRLVEAGANRLVIGSALFKTDDISETYKEFEEMVR